MRTLTEHGPDFTYIETDLPSGPRARIWLTENCAVIEVNSRITHASRQGLDRTDTTERMTELLPLLAAATGAYDDWGTDQ